ncbi:MAG: hypothetical protein F6K55_28310 [Moorea sp. SIO4A3]|nr:hypothetical protein [Moorena sp. SIO4A3]
MIRLRGSCLEEGTGNREQGTADHRNREKKLCSGLIADRSWHNSEFPLPED